MSIDQREILARLSHSELLDSCLAAMSKVERLRSMNATLQYQVAFEHEKRVEAETELGIAP